MMAGPLMVAPSSITVPLPVITSLPFRNPAIFFSASHTFSQPSNNSGNANCLRSRKSSGRNMPRILPVTLAQLKGLLELRQLRRRQLAGVIDTDVGGGFAVHRFHVLNVRHQLHKPVIGERDNLVR